MLDRVLPDLRVHSIPTGSHGSGWDLARYLFRGAAAMRRTGVDECIEQGQLGPIHGERLELLKAIHAEIEGASTSAASKEGLMNGLSKFIEWVDERGDSLSLATARSIFLGYADHLRHRVAVKGVKQSSAQNYVRMLSWLLGPVLDPHTPRAAAALQELAGIRKSKRHRRSRGLQADKQHLDDTFAFGHFLADVCAALTVEAVRGALPLDIPIRAGQETLRVAGGLKKADLDPDDLKHAYLREIALRSRAALAPEADVKQARSALINLRINAELLIFVAQSGMNLAQVQDEPRAEYRWQTDDQDYLVRAVYKGRRQGVAKFAVFRDYRDHFQRYLDWLDALGLNDGDERLFPILHTRMLPGRQRVRSATLRAYCESLGIPFVSPRTLRNTRVNWLLRRSRDPDLTAEMAAHTVETLLRVYEEGDLQSASQEIGKYHAENDPTLTKTPRTIPICLKGDEGPRPLPEIPEEAPQPDCVTPEGCLWCEHFRDVMTPDYCWRLASHRFLKSLEVALFLPPESQPLHPGNLVIERLSGKLRAIAARSAVCAEWVKEAKERVREGEYHPDWAGLIKVVESLNDA